ncbi:MAG: TIM barrel protein [Planctomycetes bacterium]|nr:TIM barrel protein [Planctomycetota bacterium]
MSPASRASEGLSRRHLLAGAAGAAAATFASSSNAAAAPAGRVVNGRIKQSLVHWCYAKAWEPEAMARVAVQLGCQSIELISPQHWPILKKYGLTCAIASCGTGFTKGFNNPKYQPQVIESTRTAIDAAADFGCKNVISFTGFREDIPDDVGMDNCVKGFKEIIGYAEKKGVNLCLEMLNSRVDITMKGHPGYQGDHTDYCIEIIRRVESPNMKLLFDIYHVQIMDGDVISRIRQYKDFIAHVHTAGNPGRKELDDTQEINYPPIMRALLEVGYTGYVGQEFIPTRDPLEGLREAVSLCDV